MSKYLFFTNDDSLALNLTGALGENHITIKPAVEFPNVEKGVKLVIIDGDSLPPIDVEATIKGFKRSKIPVVYLFSQLDGRGVMEVLNSGVVAVLFKDYPLERIKRQLANILSNFNYLEKVKEIAENDNRTRRFLNVVSSLTSDNDINKIMNDILESMLEVFKLESTVFFIARKQRLVHKIELGRCPRDYTGIEWDLNDASIGWLTGIRNSPEPVYIGRRARSEYRRVFPENTLLLPLIIKDRFIGLIAATRRSGSKKLSRNEIALLKAFAGQTAVALENARLYWDILKTREELIRQEKNALLNQTIISLNHEINNPLSIISMEAELLQKRLEDKESKVESRIARIEKNIERIKGILDRISSLDADSLHPTEYIRGKQMLNIYDQ